MEIAKLFKLKYARYGLLGCIQISTAKNSLNFPKRSDLQKIKTKAMRAGVWYKGLPKLDRILFDLTIKVAENIRSLHLAKSILAIMGKLEQVLEGRFAKLARTIGCTLAEKTSCLAQSWGNYTAKNWSTDKSFALYLAVMKDNS